jgi:GT2 family glycosyltransferase
MKPLLFHPRQRGAMPEISVIIVNWNGKHFLDVCLSALRRQTFRDFETIFVDNGSQDGSVEYVRSLFPEVKIVALKNNLGFTGGNIAGYELATGELIALLNNDTEAHPDWLSAIRRGARTYDDAGSFASKMLYFDNRHRIENCGFNVDIAGTTVDLGRDEWDSPKWTLPRKVFGACGGAVAYRRSMLEHIGFLDPDLFMIYEDVDLSFRAQLAGYECVYLPDAVVFHRYRSSLKMRPAMQVFFAQRNIDLVFLKNLPLRLILRSLPRRLLYECGSALYFTKLGSGSAFVRAKLAVLRQLPSVLAKRKAVQELRMISAREFRTLMRGSAFSSKWRKFFSPAGNATAFPSRTDPAAKKAA